MRRKGTFIGHSDQIKQVKKELATAIAEADANGCKVAPQDRLLLGVEPPIKPANR